MNRLLLTCASLLLLVWPGSTAAQNSPDAGRTNQSSGFSPSAGGFEVRFPDKPNEETGFTRVADKVVTAYRYSTRRPDYGVIYCEVPGESPSARDTVGLLKGLANTLLTQQSGAIVNDKDYSVQGKPGRMLEIKAADGATIYALILVADSRVYRVTATVPRQTLSDKLEAARLAAMSFLDSFTIVPIKRAPEETRYIVNGEGDVDRYLKTKTVNSEKPIDYGRLNGRAVKLPEPRFLGDEAPGGVYSESVEVKVVVDETGRVVAAQVVRGHPYFRSVSLIAARQARFDPTVVAGKPVKILGTITYVFAR